MSSQQQHSNSSRSSSKDDQQPAKAPSPSETEKTERDPAVERGERLQSGKDIARGGKERGPVPGASPSKHE